jgi:hypothetical protein
MKNIFLKLIFILLFNLIFILNLNLRRVKESTPTSGDNTGTNLYSSIVVTKAMKTPQWWFVNVMMPKPNDKYFREAEYNGLRYQTEALQDKMEREYNDNIRDLYDEKLNTLEQKMIGGMRMLNDKKKN